MKTGIMGGTFDPVHLGHLALSEQALKQYELAEVWFLPNGHPPHKEQTVPVSPIRNRLEMLRLAIAGQPHISINTYEAERNCVSYTFSTMEHFVRQYPQREFYFILGADSLFGLEHWKHPERIFRTCTILAALRDEVNTSAALLRQRDYLQEKYGAQIELLKTPVIPISSHEIRTRIEKHEDVSDVLPDSVYRYIIEQRIYE